ncbi:MAG TPA: hypothetical protein VEG34_16155, partial [Thermoanaerobaculia bacterium]|nr:hypothetical protein [Thermoanaerobaculia bacterium]
MIRSRPFEASVRPASRPAAALLGGLALAVLAALVPVPAWAGDGGLRCREVSFAVALTPGEAAVHDVSGVLCARGSVRHKTVQITLHG